ncbi:hypothetical protein M9H77_28773 [Catharanthus roseus]|uniref:Uncharacterized protein n=1 Tax=Catharanthus roseus TaxID=4058 RepID=A0ACC0AGJ8_CATRO|nr:hypothetical protein M9H77_28773 [Catharanthus roseus]
MDSIRSPQLLLLTPSGRPQVSTLTLAPSSLPSTRSPYIGLPLCPRNSAGDTNCPPHTSFQVYLCLFLFYVCHYRFFCMRFYFDSMILLTREAPLLWIPSLCSSSILSWSLSICSTHC